jgi:hypothetical protein
MSYYKYRPLHILFLDLKEETSGSSGRRGRDRMVLDLQMPMQSMPITTDAVGSNLDQGEVNNIL